MDTNKSANHAIESFERQLTINTTRLIESYRDLLILAKVDGKNADSNNLRITASSANIVYACQCLLDQIHDLRLNIVTQGDVDFDFESTVAPDEKNL